MTDACWAVLVTGAFLIYSIPIVDTKAANKYGSKIPLSSSSRNKFVIP
jgi:hypothetical protein